MPNDQKSIALLTGIIYLRLEDSLSGGIYYSVPHKELSIDFSLITSS